MFQLFLRARLHKLLRSRSDGKVFKARSGHRDALTDETRALAVYQAIEAALQSAENEKKGLDARIDERLRRASMSVGTDTDEYLTREAEDTAHLNFLDAEIANGQTRLERLAEQIAHFKFLKTALLSRFASIKFKNG